MDSETINIALRVLDDQLLDVEDERFGRIDDIALAGQIGGEARVSGLIVGAGAWRWRVPHRLEGLTRALTPNIVRVISWDLVREIEPGVLRVGTTKGELGFGTAHHVGARWVDELEQQSLRLTSLLGSSVIGPSGEELGRVHEVQGELDGSLSRPGALHITGVIIGRSGWIQRLVGGRPANGQSGDAGLIEWSRLERQPDGLLVAA